MADVGDLRFGRSGRKQEGVEGRTGRDLSPELCQRQERERVVVLWVCW